MVGYTSAQFITGADREGQTSIQIHTYGQCRDSDKSTVHVFGLWEEDGKPKENPRRHRKDYQSAPIGIKYNLKMK